MKLPLTVVPMDRSELAEALLIPTADALELFEVLAEAKLERMPSVFVCDEGFVIDLPRPMAIRLPSAIRLRRLAAHLYLPADGALVPPLLDDEARGMVRDRGLLFLPGGRVLEVSKTPLVWAELLHIEPPRRRAWRSLPELPQLAEELRELSSALPPDEIVTILEQGRGDIGSEPPRPRSSQGMGDSIKGHARYRLGQALTWMGKSLGLQSLAGAGAKMLQQALQLAPQLSERLMSAQESALRQLLQDFKDGKIDEALKRALPLTNDATGKESFARNANLPRHDLFFSVKNLLGSVGGAASAWFAPGDVFHSLEVEYRKQAEEAMRRGDAKRAAFIYAKLLNDYSSAARMLSRGGLHREAAILYEEVLKNRIAAAREWEAAGEIDRAVAIHEQLGDDLAAAAILERAGETDRAGVFYVRAAEGLAKSGKYREAGDLLLNRARRTEDAMRTYALGWAQRPHTSALACGLVLADRFSQEGEPEKLLQIVEESTHSALEGWSVESMTKFLNDMIRFSQRSAVSAVADDVHDRCLMLLGDRMRQDARHAGKSANLFFPADTPYAPPVVRDARFASEGAKPKISRKLHVEVAKLGRSTVTACRFMRSHGELFVGFANGELLRFDAASGVTYTLNPGGNGAISALWTDPRESMLVAVVGSNRVELVAASRQSGFSMQRFPTPVKSPAFFCQPVDTDSDPYFGVGSASGIAIYRSGNSAWMHTLPAGLTHTPRAAIAGVFPRDDQRGWLLLFFNEGILLVDREGVLQTIPLENQAQIACFGTLQQPWVQAWRDEMNELQVAWVSRNLMSWTLRTEIGRTNLRPTVKRGPLVASPAAGLNGVADVFLADSLRAKLISRVERVLAEDGSLVNPVGAFSGRNGEAFVLESNGSLLRLS
jgi:tetratricopeptide (TPR) repeat protein